jgi:hypothetical protein
MLRNSQLDHASFNNTVFMKIYISIIINNLIDFEKLVFYLLYEKSL